MSRPGITERARSLQEVQVVEVTIISDPGVPYVVIIQPEHHIILAQIAR
jgi:hypothetical protein